MRWKRSRQCCRSYQQQENNHPSRSHQLRVEFALWTRSLKGELWRDRADCNACMSAQCWSGAFILSWHPLVALKHKSRQQLWWKVFILLLRGWHKGFGWSDIRILMANFILSKCQQLIWFFFLVWWHLANVRERTLLSISNVSNTG